ncbi:MAG: hypothetical protein ABI758_03740 [Candidatus Woesebacteria bacterium]
MSTDNLNQTGFSQEVPVPLEVGKPDLLVPQKKSLIVPLAIGAFVVLLVGIVIFVFLIKRGASTQVLITPTPLPSQTPIQTDQIRSDIEPDLQRIEQSNPEGDEHPFPPVDFTTRIQEPAGK